MDAKAGLPFSATPRTTLPQEGSVRNGPGRAYSIRLQLGQRRTRLDHFPTAQSGSQARQEVLSKEGTGPEYDRLSRRRPVHSTHPEWETHDTDSARSARCGRGFGGFKWCATGKRCPTWAAESRIAPEINPGFLSLRFPPWRAVRSRVWVLECAPRTDSIPRPRPPQERFCLPVVKLFVVRWFTETYKRIWSRPSKKSVLRSRRESDNRVHNS